MGGILIGMGAQVFILPWVDSIAGFTVLFMLVTTVAAWFMTSSPRLSFFGLQMAVVFFVINMQNWARETSLSVARDRVAAVCLGLMMMWLIFDQLWGSSASVEMRRAFIFNLRLLAQFVREPVSSDIRPAIQRTAALHETINTQFDKVRSLADGVLLEFGPTRRQDLALRDRIRKWAPELRTLFIMRSASLNYRLHMPGFELPEPVAASLQTYDECSAQMLENIADRMEGKAPHGTPVPADSLALLEQTQEFCRVDERELLLSAHGRTFAPLLRQIDQVTARLANEIGLEVESA